MSERREMGALEAEVLAELWSRVGPATPAEVLEAMDTDLAYTTVMTILMRLWKKGLVERERRGRAYAYRTVVTEAELTAKRMRAMLDRSQDREGALSRFVGSLPKREERALRRILGQLDNRK